MSYYRLFIQARLPAIVLNIATMGKACLLVISAQGGIAGHAIEAQIVFPVCRCRACGPLQELSPDSFACEGAANRQAVDIASIIGHLSPRWLIRPLQSERADSLSINLRQIDFSPAQMLYHQLAEATTKCARSPLMNTSTGQPLRAL